MELQSIFSAFEHHVHTAVDTAAEKTAEEAADKKKELEEKLQARKDEKKEQEELTKDIVEAANKQAGGTDSVVQAQQEIKDMMNKLKLVEDDVKGAAVDQGI